MRITRELYAEIVAHARADAPDECCGLVSSRDGQAIEVFRIENTAHSPLRYLMNGDEQLRAFMTIEDAGLDIGIIYHSHTRSAPYPSQTDINLAFFPESDLALHPGSIYVIVGLASGSEALVRAFTFPDRLTVVEEMLEIV
ncbi:MAG TPA: M67 family metallopeptidase [Solirubrobacteraceae bacterium]|jgi:proteasome lid subunit RPN8/RPN11|nr:M67 family metallopeptidase [Solirubrobacteraceae bacterium]